MSLPTSSQPSGQPTGPYRKPRADVYTVLLILALVAILLTILCLSGEMKMYDWKSKGGPSVSVVPVSEKWAVRGGQGAGKELSVASGQWSVDGHGCCNDCSATSVRT